MRLAGGDARRALTALEAGAGAAPAPRASDRIDLAAVEPAVNRAAVRYDRDGDQHYDVTSAFIKSIRGSDVDAALHYLARMIEAGEDPRFIARRLMIQRQRGHRDGRPDGAADRRRRRPGGRSWSACPEAGIALAQATIHLAPAPKSNAVITAIDAAMADVTGRAGRARCRAHLRDGHYPGAAKLGNAQRLPLPARRPRRRRRPAVPAGRGRRPGLLRAHDHGAERALAERLARLRAILRGERDKPGHAERQRIRRAGEPFGQRRLNGRRNPGSAGGPAKSPLSTRLRRLCGPTAVRRPWPTRSAAPDSTPHRPTTAGRLCCHRSRTEGRPWLQPFRGGPASPP